MSDDLEFKRQLAELLEDRFKTAMSDPLKFYKPLDYQVLFHQSSAKIRLFIGTNRCGKTTAGMVEAIWLAAGTHPYNHMLVPNKGRIVGTDFPNAVVGTLVPKLKELIPLHYLEGGSWETAVKKNQQGIPHIIKFANGSIIQFMSADQDVSKFESFDADWVMFDEPPSEAIYTAVTRGLVDRNGIHWFVMTPINCAWIYDKIFEPARSGARSDVAIIHGDAARNPHVSSDAWSAYIQNLPSHEYQARAKGVFSHLTGRVFKDFIPERHILDPQQLPMFKDGWPKGWPVIEGIDPHVTGQKPHCVVWIGIDPSDNLHIIDYLEYDGNIQELGNMILNKRRDKTVIGSISDSSLNQETDRQNQYDLLCLTGVRPRLARKKDLLLPGINYIATLFKRNMLYIWNNCTPVIKNFKLYRWNDSKEGYPVKEDDDFIDGVRYALECNHTFKRASTTIHLANSFESYGGE